MCNKVCYCLCIRYGEYNKLCLFCEEVGSFCEGFKRFGVMLFLGYVIKINYNYVIFCYFGDVDILDKKLWKGEELEERKMYNM